jgi:hypothetical protein
LKWRGRRAEGREGKEDGLPVCATGEAAQKVCTNTLRLMHMNTTPASSRNCHTSPGPPTRPEALRLDRRQRQARTKCHARPPSRLSPAQQLSWSSFKTAAFWLHCPDDHQNLSVVANRTRVSALVCTAAPVLCCFVFCSSTPTRTSCSHVVRKEEQSGAGLAELGHILTQLPLLRLHPLPGLGLHFCYFVSRD